MKEKFIDTKKLFKANFFLAFLLFSPFLGFSQCPNIVWSDEFSGSSLDETKWEYMLGDGCSYGICNWGNNELQYYKSENVSLNNGIMSITAKQEKVRRFNYTSARIRSKGQGDWTYGRFEARIKLPTGQGLWPAFWMLSTDEVYGGWPQSGEIDIMELVGNDPARSHGTIHYGDPYPNNSYSGASYLLNSGIFNDDYHTFAIEWEPNTIRWYVDDYLFSTKTAADVAPLNWPFDQNFHFLLNVAVGGNWPGSPDNSTSFPQTMDVDYVRVYDGYFPSLSGDRAVTNQASGEVYSISNPEPGSNFSWTVPTGATILSGQGTSSITVDWGNTGGDVSVDVTNACLNKTYTVNVFVEAPIFLDYSFENFDDPGDITFSSSTGTLTEVSNPSSSGVNSSALVGKYDRNSSEQYDVLAYDVSSITDAGEYSSGVKRFYMDVYTAAPIGSVVLIQLENSSSATSSNYPTGRHSRYQGITTTQNQWERIEFGLLDQPDGSTPANSVDDIIILFATNSFTGDTYYFDNFDSYGPASTGNNSPTVSISSPADGTQYSQLSSILIEANANDSDGSIQQVEFFVDGNSIGTDNTSPYEMNWTIPADGTYSLTATATDNDAASTTSSAVDITASTSSGPSYCTSQGNANNEWISSVTIGGFSNSSGKTNYSDFTSITASLTTGSHSISLTPSYQGPSRSEYWRIWMDFNNDGDFDDSGELVFDAGSAQSGTTSGSLTIPASADGVNTRMRISMKRSSAPSSCGSINRGEVEDYTVDISGSAKISVSYDWDFQIYPNPAEDKLSILFNHENLSGDISIINPLGKLIKEIKTENSKKIDISQLPAGIYFINITANGSIKTKRFVKMN